MTRNSLKNLGISLSVMALAMTTACSQVEDNMENIMLEDGMVSIRVSLPKGMNTRSEGSPGDVASANIDILYWSLFEVEVDAEGKDTTSTHIKDYETVNAFSKSTETLKLNLPRDRKYRIALMAKHEESGFSSFSKGVMSVNYSEQTEVFPIDDDVFVGATDVIVPSAGFDLSVTLHRPFAQINWGATDLYEKEVQRVFDDIEGYEEYGQFGQSEQSPAIFETLKILSNEVSDEVTDNPGYIMDLTQIGKYDFPISNVSSCSLIAMRYLLVDQKQSSVINCKINFYSTNNVETEVEVVNAPVQANYRTNIYGRFFTDPNVFELRLEEGFISSTDIPANPSTPAE